eukprot:TRINITY_DN93477_c0_g1_i1.p1 TRINITY_DN93477_c0_g1~~TRINITY_DN93477_c0_g1_i1.p1  ORF type:complete len:302 (-),score=39.38 TRINITY_DN93477_c0_g1_i1:120-998(-)
MAEPSASCFCCFCVEEANVAFKEVWGKYDGEIQEPGCHCMNPISTHINGPLSTRVRESAIRVETKTKDNVFVTMVVTLQYRVLKGSEDKAYYELSHPESQLQSYVFNNVRAEIPKFMLDELFISKDEIARTLKTDLSAEMAQFGYEIVQALITDLEPDHGVKKSMNEINAATRMRMAASDKAEAEKILIVKAAEADAESKRLSGVGLAEMRKAVISGLHDSIQLFTGDSNSGIGQQEVMDLLLMNQFFDTMKEMSGNSRNNTLFIPHTPDAVADLGGQVRNCFDNTANKKQR